nr:LacI family transcriptional regulator [Candidatus Pantoea persica]
MVQGIEAEAEAQGYHILLCNSASQLRRESAYLSLLTGKVVDGVITMDAAAALQEIAAIIGDAPWVAVRRVRSRNPRLLGVARQLRRGAGHGALPGGQRAAADWVDQQ